MRALPTLAAALALASLAAGCSTSPCQELGERLCGCTGVTGDACKTQVEEQLKSAPMSDATCDSILASCTAPAGAELCEWLLTADGKRACGLAEPPPPQPAP